MAMFLHPYLVFFIIFHLLVLVLAQEEDEFKRNPRCQPFNCGVLGNIGFPFSNETHPDCGFLVVSHCNETVQMIQLGKGGSWFYITSISQDNTVTLQDSKEFVKPLTKCQVVNLSLPSSPFISVKPFNQSLFRCQNHIPENFTLECKEPDKSIVYWNGLNDKVSENTSNCRFIELQLNKTQEDVKVVNLYTGWFRLGMNVTTECRNCFSKGGQCQLDNNGKFNCSNPITANVAGDEKSLEKIRRGLGIGIGGLAILIVALYIIRHFKKRKYTSTSFNLNSTFSDPSSKSELEGGNVYLGVPVFSYNELAEATNNFNHEKEVGDGGFGAVYRAKLQDGREVAVKRFYEQNYRRLEHFMNEIEILTRLRHENLVSLYGCSSRNSQQCLLLVYEFIPNGTVADHLHGERAKPGFLTWPIRMKIAIETASALAYLHASGIIHRDVKTNNILLDANFSVKVADFGLSRLFPTDVTHVSTAPQGSPGYVDPEYHQCYQLTDKSDVFSFGVVLIELISSMAAVDINRQKEEINLANLAINRIQNRAIEELIDPCLSYQSDEKVRRMATSVAELAFLCLQQNKEMRPSMDEVLEELMRIVSGQCMIEIPNKEQNEIEELKSMQPVTSSPDYDQASLLNNIGLTAKWASSDTASSVSC